jgi:nucleotide-binding universal stress UspA family protein
MKKILVPCDFSEQAINAFRFALDLADHARGEIHLVSVVELPILHDKFLVPAVRLEKSFFNGLAEKTKDRYEKLFKKYKTEARIAKVKSDVLFGSVSKMLINYAKDNKMDLMIMGSHGASGIREALIGSNAERVIRKSPIPVLVIKSYQKADKIKNIVFPNTLEIDKQEAIVMKVKAIQDLFKAKLHIVFVNTPSNFTRDSVTLERLKSFAKRFMIKDYTLNVVNDTYEESGIIEFTHMIKADMIALGTHGRTGISHTLSGSVAEDVANHVDCPVWTAKMI